MTGEQQKQRAKALLQAAERGDVAAVEAMISDDFTLEEMLRVPITLPTGEPLATIYDKEAYLGFVRKIPSFTKNGMHFTYELAMSGPADSGPCGRTPLRVVDDAARHIHITH